MKNVLKLIGIGVFVFILTRIEWSELIDILSATRLHYVVLSLVLIIPVVFVRTQKWKDIVSSLGTGDVPFWSLFAMYLKGLSLGLITPGKLGEFYRAKYLSEYLQIPLGKALWTVILEKGVDFLSDATVAIIGIIILSSVFGVETSFAGVLVLSVLIILGVLLLTKKNFTKWVFEFGMKLLLPQGMREKAGELTRDFLEEIRLLNKKLYLRLLAYDAFSLTLIVVAHFFLALALSISISFWYLYIVIILVSMLTVLPVSVFGLGLREGGYIFFFLLVGISIEAALAFSLLSILWDIVFRFPGVVLLYISQEHKKL
ncbi:flippase-like domain-containing protein [Patescibacteria group bacterium]|nr:flippase-like domain-containing protein [Patescibacteria group bacterium]